MAAQPDEKQLMAGLFALTVTMMARAVLIPSTAKRTFCCRGGFGSALRRLVRLPSAGGRCPASRRRSSSAHHGERAALAGIAVTLRP